MTLKDLLSTIEFDYEVSIGRDDDVFSGEKVFKLIDKLGANLGDIDMDEFEFSKNGVKNMIERVNHYWDDYFLESGCEDDPKTLQEALDKGLFVDEISAILNPDTIIVEDF